MDRNSLIGIALIGLILVIWFQLLSPTPKPSAQLPKNISVKSSDSTKYALQDSLLNAEKEKNKLSALGQFSSAAKGVEKDVVIETDLFTAKISTKGATLKSFVQKKYLDYKKEPFDLITSKSGATALFFQTKDGKNINTSELYFTSTVPTSPVRVSGSNSVSVPFEMVLSDGKKIGITYVFKGDSYEFDYKTNLVGMGDVISGDEYQVVWSGGIAHSEKNKSDEEQSSYAHAYLAGELVKVDADKLDKDPKELKMQPEGKTKWVSVQSKYFVAAVIADNEAKGAYLEGSRNSDDPLIVFENYTVALKERLAAGTETRGNFSLYVGPLDYKLVKATGVDLQKTMDFGWEWITRPFAEWLIIPTFNFLNQYILNYGLIIILFALMIKLVTYPLTLASTHSMKKMAAIQPQVQAMQEKYKGDPGKLQSEMAKIYKEAGVNPISGCLPQLLQLPLLFAMFNVFKSSIQLRQEGFLWASDLSVPDSIYDFPFQIPVLGWIIGDHVAVYPFLLAVTQYFQMKITPTTGPAEQQKIFLYVFPVMMLFFFNNLPAGLGLYYLMFNVFGIAQQLWINYSGSGYLIPTAHHLAVVQPAAPVKKKKDTVKA